MADRPSRQLGRPVVIENKPGGSGTLAARRGSKEHRTGIYVAIGAGLGRWSVSEIGRRMARESQKWMRVGAPWSTTKLGAGAVTDLTQIQLTQWPTAVHTFFPSLAGQ